MSSDLDVVGGVGLNGGKVSIGMRQRSFVLWICLGI
jgi:hypothetical protein